MRVILALLAILTFPVVILLSAIMYGGVTPTTIKAGLSSSQIYSTLPTLIAQSLEEDGNSEAAGMVNIVKGYVSESYLQAKVENLIDDTDSWVKDKTTTPPTLSFADIKEKVIGQNPEIMEMINEASQTPEAQAGGGADFLKSDFTFPLGDSLKFIKDTYKTLTIALPVLAVLTLLYLLGIFLLSKGLASKLKWTGMVLIIASIYGFIWMIGSSVILATASTALATQDNQIVKMISPVILNIVSQFLSSYKSYQSMTSLVVLIVGVVSFAASYFVVNNNNVQVSGNKVKVKKK